MLRKLLILTCLLATVSIAFGQGTNKQRNVPAPVAVTTPKTDYKSVGTDLPSLRIYTREGKYLTNKDLNKTTLVLMMFNPVCEHCEDMTRKIKDSISEFKKADLVLVAGEMMGPYLGYFTNNTKIADVPDIRVGIDSSGYIDKAFRYQALPQINIYDKDRKLVKVFVGPTSIDSLKMFIR